MNEYIHIHLNGYIYKCILTLYFDSIFIFADFCSVSKNPSLMNFFAKKSFEQINYVSGLHQKEKRKSIQEQLQKYCSDESLKDAYETVGKQKILLKVIILRKKILIFMGSGFFISICFLITFRCI